MIIKSKKWKNSIILTISLFVVILIFEIFPRFTGIATMIYHVYEQDQKFKEAEKNNFLERSLSAENKSLKTEINGIVSNYEGSQKLSSIIAFLDDISYNNDVELVSIKPGQIIKQDNLWLQPMELNIKSKYENIFNYVRFLENSSKVIIIKGLDIKSKGPLKDSLNIKANLEVYLNL